MRVLLLGNYVNDGQESMQRFAAFMQQGLRQAGHEVQLLRPPSIAGQLWRSGQGLGKWLGYIDKFGSFPVVLRSEVKHADVVHICDHSNSFYTKYLKSVPHLVTCHDMLAIRSALREIPQHKTNWPGRQLQRLILNGLTSAQHVVCVSESTRKDLLRIADIPERRVSCTYNSLTYAYSRMNEREALSRIRKFGIDTTRPFLLHVGGNQWYKNRLGVLRIFSVLRQLVHDRSFNLVTVGEPWSEEMRRFVRKYGLSGTVKELTGIDNEDLRALYSTAAVMLFPSLQEGFGWPIVEAQACGCPVATSDRPPMNEIAGKAAIYIDPENAESAAAALRGALEGEVPLREPSLANAKRFRSGMIDSYVSLYEKVCSHSSAARRLSRSQLGSTSFDGHHQ